MRTWPECPMTDERIKIWCIYTTEYYSALKKKENLPFAATWMDLEGIMLRKEKAMAPRSSTLAWKIPWTEEPGRLQSMESLGVGHD